jgi:hypothetical protein
VNFAADFVDHGADLPPGTPPGPAGAQQYVGNALKGFPDMNVTIEDIGAERDKSRSAQCVASHRSRDRTEDSVRRNRHLANREPADCRALGVPGKSKTRVGS